MPSPATWIACVALAVALGGTAYAAVNLPAKSVGTKQLKNGAVTKQKIAKKTIAALRANAGPTGEPGPPGPPGAAGPGATSTETILPNDAAPHTVLTADGLAVKASCNGEQLSLALVPTAAGGTVDFSGTSYSGAAGVHGLNGAEKSQIELLVKEPAAVVDFDVVARDTATGPAFSAVDAHLESTCRAWAMVTPSTS